MSKKRKYPKRRFNHNFTPREKVLQERLAAIEMVAGALMQAIYKHLGATYADALAHHLSTQELEAIVVTYIQTFGAPPQQPQQEVAHGMENKEAQERRAPGGAIILVPKISPHPDQSSGDPSV